MVKLTESDVSYHTNFLKLHSHFNTMQISRAAFFLSTFIYMECAIFAIIFITRSFAFGLSFNTPQFGYKLKRFSFGLRTLHGDYPCSKLTFFEPWKKEPCVLLFFSCAEVCVQCTEANFMVSHFQHSSHNHLKYIIISRQIINQNNLTWMNCQLLVLLRSRTHAHTLSATVTPMQNISGIHQAILVANWQTQEKCPAGSECLHFCN